MSTVQPLSSQLDERVRQAGSGVLPAEVVGADPQIRVSDHADFQANGVFSLAKQLRSNPRELASRVAAGLLPDDLIASCEVSGPGFLNLTLSDKAIWRQLGLRLSDPRLGLPHAAAGKVTVIDYSQPNIAKEMHVGHLRSTIIGDALVRIMEFGGTTVVKQNHLGDWGTQFGMLIQYLVEFPHDGPSSSEDESGAEAISRLNALYRASRQQFDTDPDFAERARGRVVALQAGDPPTVAKWEEIVAESKIYFNDVYRRLDVLLSDEDAVGESYYNPFLHEVAKDLEQRGIAVRSNGALCVFFDDILGPDDTPTPLIVQKSDEGFGYAATDLAAIRYRVNTLHADRILYVVDARQALHFRMVFEAARRAGYLPEGVQAEHVSFGSVLGSDGRPFKTRAGDTVRLISLLDEAVEQARGVVAEKSPNLESGEQLARLSTEVGIGAVKYADLSTGRTRDYVFDPGRMVSFQGNTGAYLQYAYARIQSILRKAPAGLSGAVGVKGSLDPAERRLVMALDGMDETLASVMASFEPHRLCNYLYSLAQTFTEFYEACPVLRASTPENVANRIALCELTGRTLKLGLELIGIAVPERL
jgi:arginyl-tRNA synthetase